MICGHHHVNKIYPVGGDFDNANQPCTLVLASEVKGDYFEGTGFVFGENITVTATGNDGSKEINIL